jgi:hypothetical protein
MLAVKPHSIVPEQDITDRPVETTAFLLQHPMLLAIFDFGWQSSLSQRQVRLFLLGSAAMERSGRLSFRCSAVAKTEIQQVRNIRLPDAHHGVGRAPIDLDCSIRLGNGAAGEDNVVDVAGHLPGIFRLQDPGVTHTDHL